MALVGGKIQIRTIYHLHIIRVLGNTTISLRKENEDMQQHILELEKAIELQNENISTLKTKLKHPVRTLFQKIADSTH